MSTNPRYTTRPPKADKRDRKGAPVPGKPMPPSVDQQFRAIFGAPKK